MHYWTNSQMHVLLESTMNDLKIQDSEVHLKLTAVTGEQTMENTKTKRLIVCGINTIWRFNLLSPARCDQIPRPETKRVASLTKNII